MRPLLTCFVLFLCSEALAAPPALPHHGAGSEGAEPRSLQLAQEPAPPLYTFAPTGVGLTLNPPGAATTLSLRSPAYPPTVRLLSTFGLERNLTPLGGLYGHLRYELDSASTKNTVKNVVTSFVQAGVWPYEPHRSGRRTAASGFTVGVQGSSAEQPLRREGRLEFGLLSVGAGPLQFDSRGEFAVSEGAADRWGYGLTGWRAGLAGVWSATGAAPSLGAWADGSRAGRLDGWPLELGVRGGYRPAWPLPLPDGTLGLLVTAGTRVSVSARAAFGDGLLRLERVTLEPRLRGYVQTQPSPGTFAAVTPGVGARFYSWPFSPCYTPAVNFRKISATRTVNCSSTSARRRSRSRSRTAPTKDSAAGFSLRSTSKRPTRFTSKPPFSPNSAPGFRLRGCRSCCCRSRAAP